jgi:hypothetical protein
MNNEARLLDWKECLTPDKFRRYVFRKRRNAWFPALCVPVNGFT